MFSTWYQVLVAAGPAGNAATSPPSTIDTMTQSTPDRARHIATAALGEGPAADELAAQIETFAREITSPYSAALDEIFALRSLAAHNALTIQAHLEYKSFPKSRRAIAETQVDRLTQAARGNAQAVVAHLNTKPCLRVLDAPTNLTRASFEANLPKRNATRAS